MTFLNAQNIGEYANRKYAPVTRSNAVLSVQWVELVCNFYVR